MGNLYPSSGLTFKACKKSFLLFAIVFQSDVGRQGAPLLYTLSSEVDCLDTFVDFQKSRDTAIFCFYFNVCVFVLLLWKGEQDSEFSINLYFLFI